MFTNVVTFTLIQTFYLSLTQEPIYKAQNLIPYARILLNQRSGLDLIQVSPDEEKPLLEALAHLAISEELMDARESNFLFTNLHELQSDTERIQTRIDNLKDTPFIHDIDLTYLYKMTTEVCPINRKFNTYISNQIILHTDRHYYEDIKKENEYLYKVWDAIQDAGSPNFYTTSRREALKKLQLLIGKENLYNHNFPPYIPTWRIREGD